MAERVVILPKFFPKKMFELKKQWMFADLCRISLASLRKQC